MWPFKIKKKIEYRMPSYGYRFDPLPDITAFELAKVMIAVEWSKGRNRKEINDYIETWPENIRRHFKREE